MNIKTKAAAISFGLNILLTIIKFYLYLLSGSMAVLAEACHSFSDIASSLFVLIAVFVSASKNKDQTEQGDQPSSLEMLISFNIGFILLIVSGLLFSKFYRAEPAQIENALISGFIFIVFAIGSYFIYRFEIHVGEQEKSIGLISDGMHSRADMVASLLTGVSLILYSIGIVNIDRWIAFLIALFILTFAIETFTNLAFVFFRKKTDYLFRFNTVKILGLFFNDQSLSKHKIELKMFLVKLFGSHRAVKAIFVCSVFIPIAFLVISFLSSMIFTVSISEQAIVERLGKPIDTISLTEPGLHFKMPWPIDKVKKVTTKILKELHIGNDPTSRAKELLWMIEHGREEPFLSGDNNFFYPYIVLHYRINNIFDYLYRHENPDKFLDEITHRIMTHFFAKEKFYDIAGIHRSKLEHEIFKNLQETIKQLNCGIEIVSVNFKDIHPPSIVAGAFENVVAAYQTKQTSINEAIGYQNQTLPETRGKVIQKIENVKGEAFDRTAKAAGKTRRFMLSLPCFELERQIIKSHQFFQTAKNALKDKFIIVIDPKAGKPDIWIKDNFDNANKP